MKLTNEEVQRIVVRAEDEYERLKDSVHDLYDKNKELLNNNVKLREEKIKLKGIIKKAIEYIEKHNDYFLLKREVKELLSILKGVDKECI